jgi:murein DD-endopeptidase MepM/ murein hydrolase activator NlpD
VRQLSSTINSDNTAPADAAKALYLRGLAYRKMGESARAIADLGAAIWLGLPEPDKVKAFVNRGLAYKSAGLSREGDAEFAAARKAGGSAADTLIAEGGGVGEGAAAVAAFSTEVRPASGGSEQVPVGNQPAAPPTRTADASPTARSTSVSDGQQPSGESSGNRLTRWFGSVTGSSSSSEPAPPAGPAPAPQAAPPAPLPAPPPAVETVPPPEPAPPPAGRGFIWPVKGRILSGYGPGPGGTYNDGINIAAPAGTPIRAAEDGVVAYAGNELRGFGNLVLLKHPNGWMSAYAHCDAILVKKGARVRRGQTIARVGATGAVAEPQLHFELRRGTHALDPAQQLPVTGSSA